MQELKTYRGTNNEYDKFVYETSHKIRTGSLLVNGARLSNFKLMRSTSSHFQTTLTSSEETLRRGAVCVWVTSAFMDKSGTTMSRGQDTNKKLERVYKDIPHVRATSMGKAGLEHWDKVDVLSGPHGGIPIIPISSGFLGGESVVASVVAGARKVMPEERRVRPRRA
eukprot:1278450-Prymnesium_polylepis.1